MGFSDDKNGMEGETGVQDDLTFLTCVTEWIGAPFLEGGAEVSLI